jgi:hypothetical protein
MASRPAAGGGSWIEVGPERFAGWCDRFAVRHGGPLEVTASPVDLVVTAADGAVATCRVPFAPLSDSAGADPVGALAAHALAVRRVGVLLVRRGGYAAGIFEGEHLVESKVGSRYVQGRTSAGGWSQQRFARRREGQAREAYAAAADTAVRILIPGVDGLDALVTGGDTAAVAALRTDPRLKRLWAKETEPFLNLGDPRLAELRKAAPLFRAVRIRLVEPEHVG